MLEKRDLRQVNRVWQGTNPKGETFTYAQIGKGKDSYTKTLHLGEVQAGDYMLIGKIFKSHRKGV